MQVDAGPFTLWVLDVGLACCAVEVVAASMRAATPEPADRPLDVVVVAGTVTDKLAPAIRALYDRLPDPKYVVSFGACANCGGPYWDSYCVTKGVDQLVPVDVYVPGCPPRPEALLDGLRRLEARLSPAAGEVRLGPAAGEVRLSPAAGEAHRSPAARGGPAVPGRRGGTVTPAGLGDLLAGLVDGAVPSVGFGQLTVDVPVTSWVAAATAARDSAADLSTFDWLSAVDELDAGFDVVLAVYSVAGRHRARLRTRVPRADPVLPSLVPVFAGAAWHERETHEMFGIVFAGHPGLDPLLLPEAFEGHPLRKDFVLAARVAKDWPGAREPGGASPRRRQRALGVPDSWGPA